MKIALFDPYAGKFTTDMMQWWQEHGYEVRRETYYNPELVVWADIVFFHTCDNNLLSATNPDQALKDEWKYSNRPGAWDMHEMDLSGKKIVVQPIDIEVWGGSHAHDNMWNVVTHCIFIAPHIREMAFEDSRMQAFTGKTETIPFAVNPDKWTFREREPGFNIAVVAERWVSKGPMFAIELAAKLKQIDSRYHIYWLGKNNDYHWQESYYKDMVQRFELPITWVEEYVEDLDTWLDDKDYLLSCSMKEAFGANIAEAMAKGIRPLIHTFYGYEPLWGDSGWCWSTTDECVDLITDGVYGSKVYLDYLYGKGYDIDTMMSRIMDFING